MTHRYLTLSNRYCIEELLKLGYTATFDNGKEFAKHKKLTSKTGIKVFFADAYGPWQRGANENMNRYVRQFIPKGTDFGSISH